MTQPEDVRQGWTSASNAQADRLCAGRHNAQKGLPDIKGEWADHGTAIHAALADSGNTKALDALTPEQRDMFDSHREIEKQVIQEIWKDWQPDGSSTKVFRHQRFWCRVPDVSDKPKLFFQHSGEADFVMVRSNTALIQDYKSLAGDVAESPENEQLRDLAVMVWRTYGISRIYVAINQPLVTRVPKLCLYQAADLIKAEELMRERVRNSNHPEAVRTAGEIQCQWCKATSTCNQYARWSAQIVPMDENPFFVSMSGWTPEQRALVADHLPRLQRLIDDSRAFLKHILEHDPNAVPGFYLKPGATRKPINDPQELFNRFLAMDGSIEQFMKCVKITKDELEQQVRAVTKEKGKGLKLKMDQLLDGLVDIKPTEPSLAKKED